MRTIYNLCNAAKTYKRSASTLANTLNPLPVSFLRGGTSKGIFINRSFLPDDRREWDRIFLGIMGSPDRQYGRQLNGMGGGVSSLSKVVVVGLPQSSSPDIDVEYTFAQIGIQDAEVDYSGNCGNLSSVVGIFAVDEGICKPRLAKATASVKGTISPGRVRASNTNTSKVIETTFPIVDEEGVGLVPELGLEETSIAGVSGRASSIILDFVDPAGARTGKLLPSGNATDPLPISGGTISASLVDATNPSVFVRDVDLRVALNLTADIPLDYNSGRTLELLELVRRAGAERMSLDPSAQAQPKIAVLNLPEIDDTAADIGIRALSMGVAHKAVPMTVGLCLGVASNIRDSIPWAMLKERCDKESSMLRIRHPGGIVEVGADIETNGHVRSAKVVRTGRRLMEGVVWW